MSEQQCTVESLPIGSLYSHDPIDKINRVIFKKLTQQAYGVICEEILNGGQFFASNNSLVYYVMAPDQKEEPNTEEAKEIEWLPDGFTSRAQWLRYINGG